MTAELGKMVWSAAVWICFLLTLQMLCRVFMCMRRKRMQGAVQRERLASVQERVPDRQTCFTGQSDKRLKIQFSIY